MSCYAGTVNIDVLLLTLYVVLAIGLSFLCSIAEAVLLSITPTYIEGQKSKRPQRAALLQRLKTTNVDQSLAAILTLNTIAHTAGAIGAGAKATVVFGSAWFGVFSAVMTLLILFLSEIIPKTIGALYWSKLVTPMAWFVRSLIVLLFPLVWLSERLTKFISHGKPADGLSRSEFIAMARMAKQSGQIGDDESRILHNLFRFGAMRARDIMTPRTVVTALPVDLSIADAAERLSDQAFSRVPVYKASIDEVTGFVLRTEVLLAKASGHAERPLRELLRDIRTVPETATLPSLLDLLLRDRQHLAMVVDEYGGTRGLVTLEDVVETLLGVEIMDETDSTENMRQLARQLWQERAESGDSNADLDERLATSEEPPSGGADR